MTGGTLHHVMSYDCIKLGVCCMAFRKLVRLFILGGRGVGAFSCLGGVANVSSRLEGGFPNSYVF